MNLLKVALLFYVAWQFNLEKDTRFPAILPLIIIGFAIHYWLPFRFKPAFFLLLGFASFYAILGFKEGSFLIAIGLILIGTCHLPLKYNFRLILLLLILAILVLFRLRSFPITEINILLPFIGSMFMFRLILYFYELRFEKKKIPLSQRLTYFFILPNVCFPLFPIVDFKNFINTYYCETTKTILDTAIQRIFRGVTQLIVYRIIYYYLVPGTADIENIYDILQFMIFSFTMILRLSGMFHLVLGIIGLFGYHLPEIFNNYFLASNFNNLWRRINTYWREFMMKIFYYPIYFKIRKLNETYAIPITILIVFVINWFMHGYQWFWIRGSFPLAWNDLLFWMTFGITVMLNSMYQERHPRQAVAQEGWNLKDALLKIIQTMAIFLFMCTIWMMWSSSSINEWLYLLSFFKTGTSVDWLKILSGILVLLFVFTLISYSLKKGLLKNFQSFYIRHQQGITFILIILISVLSIPQLNSKIEIEGYKPVSELQKSRLSKGDKQTMERGYYQNLLNADNVSIQLWETQLDKPREWNSTNSAVRKTTDLMQTVLAPSAKTLFKGASLSTNKWGMRDKEYEKEKPAGTYRFALLGGSYEMGSGVNDDETFEALTEKKMNEEWQDTIEILNFAAGGYHLFQQVEISKTRLKEFQPDAVFYFAHTEEFFRVNNKITELVVTNTDLRLPYMKQIVKQSGANASMCRLEIQNRLKPYTDSLVAWGYSAISAECRKSGAIPIWVYLPALGDNYSDEDFNKTLQLAKKAGFITISLKDVYLNNDKKTLMIADWDTHPNAKGHRLISELLYLKLSGIKEKLKLK
ncbi:MAG: SGNH/GDSL hydrolase family protein [Bacteroidota bacterium]|nr:SGNH/GDSL hydrolase family protein [Bacteroidota bacterium]